MNPSRQECTNIAEILHAWSHVRPDAAAIIEPKRGEEAILTFAEMEFRVGQAAALLESAGFQPGDVILLLCPMSIELYVALLAIFRLGLVAMFLDPSAGVQHVEDCCRLQSPKGLIATPRAHLLRLASPALRRISIQYSVGIPMPGARSWESYRRFEPSEQSFLCSPETPALLTFTSGSTGQPKAAMRTHSFLMAQHRALEASLGLRPGEIDLVTLPIFVLANLASGMTSLIPNGDLRRPGSIAPRPLLEQIRHWQPTRISASPALLQRVLDGCVEKRLSRVKAIFTGGAPVFPALMEGLAEIAPGARIVAVYGSTEAEPIAHIALHEMGAGDREAMLNGAGLLAGPPVPQINLRILTSQWGSPIGPFTLEQFEQQCLSPGEPGEIVVSGDHVLSGYLHGRGDEETKFQVEGIPWHRTGDAGYLDDAGRLWLLGRCSARLEDRKGVLYPFTVECAARSLPQIQQAALVGYQGRRLLLLELKAGDSEDVSDALSNLLHWAGLDEIQFVHHIPVDRRHNAKIDYPALQRMVEWMYPG